MLLYDNMEDVRSKLSGTICYYKGNAVFVKEIAQAGDGNGYVLIVTPIGSRSKAIVNLSDPELNYMSFNLGYTNHGGAACWWYRHPIRQYRQGLRADQLGCKASRQEFYDVAFDFSRPVADMLENIYPKFSEAEKKLKDSDATIIAFNRNFAASWDHVHKDMVLEYKGKPIGHSTNLRDFKLMDDYKHLTESLMEAVA
jgi:hypothetical protein